MRIELHIGVPQCGANRLQAILADKRDQLRTKGVLYPRAPGNRNHTRLYMSVTDPDHVDPLRFNRGFIAPDKQIALHDGLIDGLAREIEASTPEVMILSASQLSASLALTSELERLRDLLKQFSEEIRITAHVDEPARLLARHYAEAVFEGRSIPLSREIAMSGEDWWPTALREAAPPDPAAGVFLETQAAPFWLDYTTLIRHWEETFGAGSVTLRAYRPALFYGADATEEIRAAFGIADQIGRAEPASLPEQPAAAWITRARRFNHLLLQLLERGKQVLPRPLWRQMIGEMRVDGPAIDPASLSPISDTFAAANAALTEAYDLPADLFHPPGPAASWSEADPTRGFRASQYLLAFLWRIEKATEEARTEKLADLALLEGEAPAATPPAALSERAKAILPPVAVQNYEKLRRSSYAPHNRLGQVDEESLAAAYTPATPRELPGDTTGNVIVGCMKNEAPYILEWVAYHRAIGIDDFLIYTNGCEDGTDEILARLQEMGVLQHRLNDDWKGKSPQQFALNRALKEPVIRKAEWLIHIDVDEFINIRCGNGTLQDFFARVPDATNVAMTWRLFGYNGVTELRDDFVIDQFDTAAPKYCPKPHTAWGFKTMFKNIGAYEKISCHRPNKLAPALREKVKWVNGSGRDMTREVLENGWRNSKKSIGYDLLQLNHYALRSAESFLIKRQRGRALHVDRSIGLNYWIRMDWSVYRDVTIKRNLPRLRAEFDRLLQDDRLRALHQSGLDWHRAKAEELRQNPEFRDLYSEALKVELTDTERVAYALALDMES